MRRRGAHLAHDRVDVGRRRDGNPVQNLAAERATRWLRVRLGPVHARNALAVVPAKGVLAVADRHARVQQRRAKRPQDARELARRQQVVDRDFHFEARAGVGGARGAGGLGHRRGG